MILWTTATFEKRTRARGWLIFEKTKPVIAAVSISPTNDSISVHMCETGESGDTASADKSEREVRGRRHSPCMHSTAARHNRGAASRAAESVPHATGTHALVP